MLLWLVSSWAWSEPFIANGADTKCDLTLGLPAAREDKGISYTGKPDTLTHA